jgi:3-hydroxybutyryl-CoA dehydrogenase
LEIGIIGKGKMGRDIFNHFFQYDHKMVLICRRKEDVEELKVSIEKQLGKMLKRSLLTEAEYQQKRKAFVISNQYADLASCELVIESVLEDKMLKQEIFSEIEPIVKPECILATNTSSIPLDFVFEKCKKKNRCMGIHFFFPVKLTRTVEINKTSFTEEPYVEIVKELLTKADKSFLELDEKGNMILTRMFTTVITQIYKIYEESILDIEEIDRILKDSLVTYGLFEIIDSTGLNIIMKSIENLNNPRYSKLYAPLYNKGERLLACGYQGGVGNKGLLAYERENPTVLQSMSDAELAEYKKDIILRMQSLIINESAFIMQSQSIPRDKINEAIKEVFGLSEDPISMLKRVGSQEIINCLLANQSITNDDIYKPMDLAILNAC